MFQPQRNKVILYFSSTGSPSICVRFSRTGIRSSECKNKTSGIGQTRLIYAHRRPDSRPEEYDPLCFKYVLITERYLLSMDGPYQSSYKHLGYFCVKCFILINMKYDMVTRNLIHVTTRVRSSRKSKTGLSNLYLYWFDINFEILIGGGYWYW